MSQSIYDVLRNIQEAGYSLVDKSTGVALARTHLETGLLSQASRGVTISIISTPACTSNLYTVRDRALF